MHTDWAFAHSCCHPRVMVVGPPGGRDSHRPSAASRCAADPVFLAIRYRPDPPLCARRSSGTVSRLPHVLLRGAAAVAAICARGEGP